jgi:glutamine amidotransferase
MIAIIDYGMGNLMSVLKAFEYLGEDVEVTANPNSIQRADKIVLPGVGAFPDAMASLVQNGWVDALQKEVREKAKPFLGICLGMQLLAEQGEENHPCKGLGWIKGTVKRFALSAKEFKIPHVGWDEIRQTGNSSLFRGIKTGSTFYFVHSFHMICEDEQVVAAFCDYGYAFPAAIEQNNIFATQFHPEKSQDNGLKILENFIAWNA